MSKWSLTINVILMITIGVLCAVNIHNHNFEAAVIGAFSVGFIIRGLISGFVECPSALPEDAK